MTRSPSPSVEVDLSVTPINSLKAGSPTPFYAVMSCIQMSLHFGR